MARKRPPSKDGPKMKSNREKRPLRGTSRLLTSSSGSVTNDSPLLIFRGKPRGLLHLRRGRREFKFNIPHQLRRNNRAASSQRSAREPYPLEKVGTIPQREAMGHRPRRLQPGRKRLELLQPRPVPFSRLSLGRRRLGRHLRRQTAALFCSRT